MHLLFDVSEKIFLENTGFGGSGCLVVCGFGGSFLRGFFFAGIENENECS